MNETARLYLKGNEAIAYGALEAGLNAYFAYPITPSSEIPETLAKEFGNPKYPRFKYFLQSASELEAINMVIGAAAGGDLAMTATSSPGFSLKQEGLSYAACMELPFLVVNIARAGPGLGNLGPEQGDYFQATKGGGHGNYRLIVLAPSSVQEMASMPKLGFDLAFRYRNPVIILGDAFIGQLKEDIELPHFPEPEYEIESWAATGANGRPRHVINSLELDYEKHYRHVQHMDKKYHQIEANELRFEAYQTEDADVVLVAYGIAARIAKAAVNKLRKRGIRAGLFRPITLWPFPKVALKRVAEKARQFIVVELSTGQLREDVLSVVGERAPVDFAGKWGGLVPTVDEVVSKVRKLEVAVA